MILAQPTNGMLQAGAVGSGMTSIKFAAHQRSQLGGVQRQARNSIVAAAHGVSTKDKQQVNAFLSTRGQEAFAMYGQESIRSMGGFIGAGAMGEGTSLINTSGSRVGGICGPCRLCCKKVRRSKQVADDTMQEGLITTPYLSGQGGESSDISEQEGGEWSLVLSLALPLLGGKLADNVSTIGMQTLWGNLGTIALAAGNLATSYQYLTLAFIYGAQQAIYSMVPQATGALAASVTRDSPSAMSTDRPPCRRKPRTLPAAVPDRRFTARIGAAASRPGLIAVA